MEITSPRLKINSYFTITIDDYYLTNSITFISLFDIPKYLTKNISDIPDNLLFNTYDEAIKCGRRMFEKHNLVRRNNDIKIIKINKVEGIEYE